MGDNPRGQGREDVRGVIMKTCRLKRLLKNTLGILFVAGLCLGLSCAPQALASSARTIRVGFPLQKGLAEIDDAGDYSGYTYEYLQEIAQYTGWEYEFVQVPGGIDESLTEMLRMLQAGEIDLLGAMVYSDTLAQEYDYPGSSYGMAYSVLWALEENTKINESNYRTLDPLRIAVLDMANSRIAALEQFCEMNQITYELIRCGTQEEQTAALKDGRADVLLDVDLNRQEGVRTIAKFAPQPYYFATTKGNSEIVNKLNFAILKINEADPYFAVNLYDKYFGGTRSILVLSDEEQAYISEAGTIPVAVSTADAPIQRLDEKTGDFCGISVDLLRLVAQRTGLAFSFEPAGAPASMRESLADGKIVMVAGMPYDYNVARDYGVALTRPYLETKIIMVLHKDLEVDDFSGLRIALVPELSGFNRYGSETVWRDTIEECMEAVERGEADYSYGDSYAVQYHFNRSAYRNLLLIPEANISEQICMGVSKQADVNLLTIINKVVNSISDADIQSIIYTNTVESTPVTFQDFIDSNPRAVILAVVVFALLLLGAMSLYFYLRVRTERALAFENLRYQQLCKLTGEHLFEYDYRKDCLTLSEESSKELGRPRVMRQYAKQLAERVAKGEEDLLPLYEWIVSGKDGMRDIRVRLPDGNFRWMRLITKNIGGAETRPDYVIGKMMNVQREREEREYLLRQAQSDSLTGIYNAATCRDLITKILAGNRKDDQGALFIIDIDCFKEVNDRFGHFAGDQVLMETAAVLRAVFRKEDVIGRLGGDEFLVFMRRTTSRKLVESKCEMLLERIHGIFPGEDGHPVSVSVGVALSNVGQSFDALYKEADGALYAVKKRGRDSCEIV